MYLICWQKKKKKNGHFAVIIEGSLGSEAIKIVEIVE